MLNLARKWEECVTSGEKGNWSWRTIWPDGLNSTSRLCLLNGAAFRTKWVIPPYRKKFATEKCEKCGQESRLAYIFNYSHRIPRNWKILKRNLLTESFWTLMKEIGEKSHPKLTLDLTRFAVKTQRHQRIQGQKSSDKIAIIRCFPSENIWN